MKRNARLDAAVFFTVVHFHGAAVGYAMVTVTVKDGAFTMGNSVAADTDITDATPVRTTLAAYCHAVNEVSPLGNIITHNLANYYGITSMDFRPARAPYPLATAGSAVIEIMKTRMREATPPRHVRQLKDATLENSRPGQYCSLSPMPEWGRKRAAGRMPAPQVARASCPEPLIL